MIFGRNRPHSQGKKPIVISVNRNGIGEEQHPEAQAMERGGEGRGKGRREEGRGGEEEERKSMETGRIIAALIREQHSDGIVPQQALEIVSSSSRPRLYLNRIFSFIKRKKDRLLHNINSGFFRWWRKDTTEDMKDLLKFITIHGCLGASVIISALTIIPDGNGIILIQYIKEIRWLTALLYVFGTGSAYYLLLDMNKVLKDTWKMNRRRE